METDIVREKIDDAWFEALGIALSFRFARCWDASRIVCLQRL